MFSPTQVTLLCSLYMKLELEGEVIGAVAVGWFIILVNVVLPGVVVLGYYRSTRGQELGW